MTKQAGGKVNGNLFCSTTTYWGAVNIPDIRMTSLANNPVHTTADVDVPVPRCCIVPAKDPKATLASPVVLC